MFFDWFRRRSARRETARRLYLQIVGQSRAPAFYAEYGVADTLDGRFDMLALHAFLALRRLRRQGGHAAALAQDVLDIMFADMDRSLRELGVSDHSIGRRVKDMVKAFYGRAAAYDRAIERPDELADALLRNVYRGNAERRREAARLAAYAAAMSGALEAQPLSAILGGDLRFAAPEER